MVEILRTEVDSDHRYRLTRTDRGVLLSCSMRNQLGLMLGPSEWLYQTEEAAAKGMTVVMLMNAWWTATTRGYPKGDLMERLDKAAVEAREAIDRLNDQPLVGDEVRELRRSLEDDAT